MPRKENKVKVLVTTSDRGVFFGELVGEANKEKVLLKNARNVLYWTAQTRGFLGLASDGPGEGCRVGPAAPELTLFGITSVSTVTDHAAERFEAAPWS